jgi:hypothetical protein
MNHNHIRSVTCGALMLVGASMASAQEFSNLGELLDKGGKRLDAAELKALLIGATASGGATRGNLDTETTFANDGKATGRFYGTHPEISPSYRGTWNINEQGQICVDMTPDAHQIRPFKGCSSYYSLNNVYYVAASDDRSAVVRMRKMRR